MPRNIFQDLAPRHRDRVVDRSMGLQFGTAFAVNPVTLWVMLT